MLKVETICPAGKGGIALNAIERVEVDSVVEVLFLDDRTTEWVAAKETPEATVIVSRRTPLWEAIEGAQVGDSCTFVAGKQQVCVQVLSIRHIS